MKTITSYEFLVMSYKGSSTQNLPVPIRYDTGRQVRSKSGGGKLKINNSGSFRREHAR